MAEKQLEKRTRIKVKRIGIRGDEVAILFFSLVFLAFLFISFFRLSAVGKLFDDFLFTFLFGWSKYLVYGFLFVVLLPIFFNFYFRIKASFIIGMLFTFFIISWFVQNISIIINNKNMLLWKDLYFYQFEDLSAYFFKWWNTTIINNYYGFFAQPISFTDWNSVESFFPSFATGGIVANFLIYITAFGGFINVLAISSILLFIGLSWILVGKPHLLLMIIFFFLMPLINYIKKRRINRISEKSLQHKTQIDTEDTIIKQTVRTPRAPRKETLQQQQPKPKPVKTTVPKERNKEKILQDVIQESGTLSPFGQITRSKTKVQDKENSEDI
ncbi:MFS transporter [Spiroplasma platyhelix]|uniref:MFS transporter n=1 Tax=Spiroplasma platyhelix PALS-1 TaxID=1276218 RepID=A0A846U8Y0_9MOLU|nr:MFS transporter [Spiroplasma platyhelix]NKE38333.1 MFS transporter [Spiroplasma platyhelix PALS-1]